MPFTQENFQRPAQCGLGPLGLATMAGGPTDPVRNRYLYHSGM